MLGGYISSSTFNSQKPLGELIIYQQQLEVVQLTHLLLADCSHCTCCWKKVWKESDYHTEDLMVSLTDYAWHVVPTRATAVWGESLETRHSSWASPKLVDEAAQRFSFN